MNERAPAPVFPVLTVLSCALQHVPAEDPPAAQPACLTRFSTTPLGCSTLLLYHACLKYLSKAGIKVPKDLFLTVLTATSNSSAWSSAGSSSSPKHSGRAASRGCSTSLLYFSVSSPSISAGEANHRRARKSPTRYCAYEVPH